MINKTISAGLLLIIIACTNPNESKEQKVVNDTLTQTVYKEDLSNREKMKFNEIDRIAPIGLLTTIDSTHILTETFKGKLLVIDFWATWCSPCIAETPEFKKMEEKYENEKVEFITVSIDDEYSYWRDYITENKWKTDNYWFGLKEVEPFFSFIYSEEKIENETMVLMSLPKYVIISPEGKILNNKANKPSTPEFEHELTTLIHKYDTQY